MSGVFPNVVPPGKCCSCKKSLEGINPKEVVGVTSCFDKEKPDSLELLYCSTSCMEKEEDSWRCVVCQTRLHDCVPSKSLTVTDKLTGSMMYIAVCSPPCFKKIYKQMFFDESIFLSAPFTEWTPDKRSSFFSAVLHVRQEHIDSLKTGVLDDKTDIELALSIVMMQWLNPICRKCHRKDGELQRCGSCRLVFYCSTGCQAQDWEEHRTACQHENIPGVGGL